MSHDGLSAEEVRASLDHPVVDADGQTPSDALKHDWPTTQFVAGLLRVKVRQKEVEQGRRKCAALLAQQGGPGDGFFAAIKAGKEKEVARLLDEGASLKDWDSDGSTPLAAAAFAGQVKVARLLLESGAKVHARNKDMTAPLHAAALLGHADVIALLLDHEADIDVRDGKANTPLHLAALLAQVEAVELLLEEDADASMKEQGGLTPFGMTQLDWGTVSFIMDVVGIEDTQRQYETRRAKVAKLLRGR